MIDKKSWNEFRETGLLLLLNQFLHIFGWAIVVNISQNGDVIDVFPARVKFRGFSTESTDSAYKKISKYMLENSKILNDETNE